MFQRSRMIGGLDFDTTPSDEGYADSFTTVVGINNAVDFDYDGQEEWIYWVEFDKEKTTVNTEIIFI